MKLFRTLAVTAGLIPFAVPASPALADGFTLNLSTPSTPVVGKPIVIRATGTIPAQTLAGASLMFKIQRPGSGTARHHSTGRAGGHQELPGPPLASCRL
jgi:hypothetical protein